MSDINEQAQPVTPATGGEQPDQQVSQRAVIEQKYQQLYGQQQPESTPEPAPTPTPVPVQQQIQQPDPQAEVLQAMAAKIAELETKLAKPAEAAEQPQDWLALLAEGKKTDGEKAMAEALKQHYKLDEIQNQAVNQALAMFEAKQQIDNFITTVRSDPKNSDVLVMEPYITAAVARRYDEAVANGKVKTPGDSVTIYKEAVNAELEIARNLALQLRGAGKNEAQIRQQQVLASQTITPNSVNLQRDQTGSTQQSDVDPTTAYFQERVNRQSKMRGLLPV